MRVVDSLGQNLVLERVPNSSSPLFAPCLAILADSIPADEQLPKQRLTKLLARDDYRLYALRRDSDVTGLAILYLSSIQAFALLDYMAVRADLRGQGIGSTLFREIVNVARRERRNADWLILEVDDDREGTEEVCQANRRRIEFYRRLGASLLANVPYRYPSANGVAVPMRLMVYPLRPEARLSPQDIRLAIADIFAEIHGRGRNDRLLAWILTHAPSVLVLE